jgi:hydroxyacylglutathione hydrolase
LARIGFDNVLGYLNGGFESWKLAGKQIDKANRISAQEFAQQFNQKPMVIDVRNESEFDAEHIVGAINIPLDYLNYNLSSIPKDKPFVIHCAGGYRSMIASSILKSRGWEQFVDVQGGFSAIAQTSVPKTAFVCQSKAV